MGYSAPAAQVWSEVLKTAVCAVPDVVPPKAMTLSRRGFGSGRNVAGPNSSLRAGVLQSGS